MTLNKLLISTIILLVFSCREKTKTNGTKSKKPIEISKIEPVINKSKIEPQPHLSIQDTIGEKTRKEYLLGYLIKVMKLNSTVKLKL